MRCMFHGPGVQVVALVPVAGPVPPPISVVRPPDSAVSHELRTNKMHVRINAAGGDDFSFAGDHFGARADDHSGRHAAHDVGIAGLADCRRFGRREFRCRLCTIPQWSTITALVITRSSAPSAEVAEADWPMPSRITLPPPIWLRRREW